MPCPLSFSLIELLHESNMAEEVGFEPTDAFTSTDFKSAALSQTQPSLHKNHIKLLESNQSFLYGSPIFSDGFEPSITTQYWGYATVTSMFDKLKIGLIIRFERTFSITVSPGDLLAIEALTKPI